MAASPPSWNRTQEPFKELISAEAIAARVAELGLEVSVPPRELCTDNAAMIASAARFRPALAFPDYLALDAYASGERRPPNPADELGAART